MNENLSSRSAKLRYAIKKKDTHNIVTDIQQKFKHLIDIEDYGKNYEKIIDNFFNLIFNIIYSIH